MQIEVSQAVYDHLMFWQDRMQKDSNNIAAEMADYYNEPIEYCQIDLDLVIHTLANEPLAQSLRKHRSKYQEFTHNYYSTFDQSFEAATRISDEDM
jgi:hypothetical protein